MCRGRLGMRLRVEQTDPAPSHDEAAPHEDVICVTSYGSVGALALALPHP